MSAPALTVQAAGIGGLFAPLPGLTELELVRGLGSPAANLSAVFAASKRPENFARIRVLNGEALLFEGGIDRQECALSGSGLTVSLEARDRGAGPLDNEAMPRTLWGANLTTMFTRLLAPYGFVLHNRMPARTLPVFTVYKGQSEWEAFCEFVRRMHGLTPHVEGNAVVVGRPSPGRLLRFSNTKPDGIPFSSLSHRRAPYELLSKLYLRDEEGYYSSSVTDPAAEAAGIRRVRYLIPSTELMDGGGSDAKNRIRRARYAGMQVVLQCPGLVEAAPGQEAAVEDVLFSQQNLLVDEIRLMLGKNGVQTRLTLKSWLYYG